MSVEASWIRSHVERCLQQARGDDEICTDDDGDYPFRWGTAMCWVRVASGEPYFVRVFAHAAHGVKRSAKLLAELNDLSAKATTAKVYWSDGVVVVSQTLHGTGVTTETLGQACTAVGAIADDIGHLVTALYGGATPFEPSTEPAEEELQ